MNVFHPRTFSTDWEVMVVDKLERCVDTDKLLAFAGYLRRALDLPVQVDWNTLEFAMGVNHSFDQFWTRIRQVTDRATQIVREFNLDLVPVGAHPVEEMFNASHVHVGTIHDESAGIHLENVMLKYVPAFAALAANSPAACKRRGEFKSYRVRERAHGCSEPGSVRDPRVVQSTWGSDANAKLYGHPTVEVRIIDCASSRRLLAEMATFIAAFLHHLGTRDLDGWHTPEVYQACMTNRWAAARFGLQATFTWDGKARPVAEVLDEMLDQCQDELAALGVKRSDLGLLEQMLRKRTCHADYVLQLAERYPDPYLLASAFTKLFRHWDVFDRFLETAPTLEPVPLPDEEAILAEHLSTIGEDTHFYRTREAMAYPAPAADGMIEKMVRRGVIRKEIVAHRGILLSRTG